MSREAVVGLLERLEEDRGFQMKLEAAGDAKEAFQIAKSEGFEFSREEFRDVMEELQRESKESKELSDDELGSVTGGLLLYRMYFTSSVRFFGWP